MFKKGDVVVAKDEFLDAGETLKDTVGIVVSYNPENDYLVVGEIDSSNHVLPHTYSRRGEFYRIITPKEIREFGLDGVKEGFDINSVVDQLLAGRDLRNLLSESNETPQDFERQVYSALKRILNSWGAYIGDGDQWMELITIIAENVWDDVNKD